jgi:hypothetical protein
LPSAKQWLDRQAAEAPARGLEVAKVRAQAAKEATPHDTSDQERLFKEFLEWSRQRPKR